LVLLRADLEDRTFLAPLGASPSNGPWAAASPIAWPLVSPSDTEGISYDRLIQIILKYVF